MINPMKLLPKADPKKGTRRKLTLANIASSSGRGERPNLVIWSSLIALLCFLLWAWQAELDQITRAQGQIIASGRTQIIQASDGGVLSQLLVKEGDKVERSAAGATGCEQTPRRLLRDSFARSCTSRHGFSTAR